MHSGGQSVQLKDKETADKNQVIRIRGMLLRGEEAANKWTVSLSLSLSFSILKTLKAQLIGGAARNVKLKRSARGRGAEPFRARGAQDSLTARGMSSCLFALSPFFRENVLSGKQQKPNLDNRAILLSSLFVFLERRKGIVW